MKKLLLALALSIAGFLPAWAATCTCAAGTTCTTGASTNWSCGAIPGVADDIIVPSTATLSYTNSITVNSVAINNGGTFKCVDDTTARTLTIAGHLPTGCCGEYAFWLKAGATMDCDGADPGTAGVDFSIVYSGTMVDGGIKFLAGDGAFSSFNLTTDAVWKHRGLRRLVGSITNFGHGATDDFVYCADLSGTVISTPANGDSIVFTSGRLYGYWGRVVTITAECTTACAGGACDIQFDMNHTDRDIRSFVKVAGLGGPSRVGTPDDTDANGTADNDTAFPQNGDSVDIFKPSFIQGGANAITQGIQLHIAGVQANVRYLNWRGLTPDQSADICTAGDAGLSSSSIHPTAVISIAPEGDMSFINIYDHASIALMEWNATDHTDDTRPNYPLTTRFWYYHDPDVNVPGTCTGTLQRVGGGSVISTDNPSDTYRIDGYTMEGHHYARLNTEVINASGPQVLTASIFRNVRMINTIIHDIPFHATYANATNALFKWDHGQGDILGLAVWDIGSSTDGPLVFSIKPRAAGTSPQSLNKVRIQNLYLVNYDKNADTVPGGLVFSQGSSGADATVDSSNNRISNSYLGNGVGYVGQGGAWFYNFILNGNLEDANATCVSPNRRAAIDFPVLAYGNVILADKVRSCWTTGIGGFHDAVGQIGIYSNQTRKIVSNVIYNPQANAGAVSAGVFFRTSGTAESLNNDIYHNLVDLNGVNSAAEYGIDMEITTVSGAPRATIRNNIIANALSNGVVAYTIGGGTDAGYNRFYRITSNVYQADYDGGGACTTSGCPGDVDDDDNDFLTDFTLGLFSPACDDTIRRSGTSGYPVGPLAYGIRDFGYFHPAAIAAMDARVYRFRYNWLMCSGANQDAIPR